MIDSTSTLADLLADCDAHGIKLVPTGDGGLRIDTPEDALTLDLLARLKTHKAELLAMLEPASKTTPVLPVATSDTATKPAEQTVPVCRCGSTTWRDVVLNHPPHNGSTVRRDCAECRRFIGFPKWHGEDTLQCAQYPIE